MERPGIVEQALDQPRSYLVDMEKGSLWRNRSQLTGDPVAMTPAAETASPVPPEADPGVMTSAAETASAVPREADPVVMTSAAETASPVPPEADPVVMTSAAETASPVPREAAPRSSSCRTTRTQCLIETI